MGLGTVTLLEINEVPNGKRIAFCLPSGEFIVVMDTCAPIFGASDAAELYGCNLFQFLVLKDAERLDDFLQTQQQDGNASDSGHAMNQSQHMRMMVRLSRNPRTQLWIRLSTTPLTLRMMRCIDTIRSLSHPLGLFADSSSFVLSEDEFKSVLRNPLTDHETSQAVELPPPEDDDDLTFVEFENSCRSPASCPSVVPLELKHHDASMAMAHCGIEDAESDEVDDDCRASLSNLAFEADWSSEALQNDDYGLFPADSITSTPPDTNSMTTNKPRFRAELVT